jgi:hypothetical protein
VNRTNKEFEDIREFFVIPAKAGIQGAVEAVVPPE